MLLLIVIYLIVIYERRTQFGEHYPQSDLIKTHDDL